MRILRRPQAMADAEAIADWIGRDSAKSALRFLESVEVTLRRLAEFPASGSPLVLENVALAHARFARGVGFHSYIVFYIEHQQAIEIIRILHGARDIEGELSES